jgi:opacity protein-like surface antigen
LAAKEEVIMLKIVTNGLSQSLVQPARFFMKNFKLASSFIALCLLPCVPVSSSAAENPYYFYLGGGVGYGRMNGEDFTNANNDFTKNKVSWKGLIGVKMNGPLALEGQYIDFGAYNRDDDRIEATGWTAGVVVDFFNDAPVVPYGKVGALLWETDNRFSNISLDDDGTDVTFGLGLRFDLTHNLAIRTEYERFKMNESDVDSVSATVQYHFF